MALSRTAYGPYLHDNTGFAAQGTGPFTTGSFTPPDNSLLCVWVLCGSDSPGSESSYVVTGGSLTWTKRLNRTITYSGDGFILQFWTAPVSTGASMQITVTHTGINSYSFGVFPFAYTGYNTSSPVGGSATGDGTGTTNSLTLSAAPTSTSYVEAALVVAGSNGDASDVSIAPGSSFIELVDTNSPDSFAKWQNQNRTSSTSDAVSWSTSTSASSPFDQRIYGAIEIQEAAAAGGIIGSGLLESTKLRRAQLIG